MKRNRFWMRVIAVLLAVLVWFQPLLPVGVRIVFAFSPPILDGRLDDVYLQYGAITRYKDTNTHTPTSQPDVAGAYLYILEDEDHVYVFYYQDMYYANDNSYGENMIHWEAKEKGYRNFGDIEESDMGEFTFEDAQGGIAAHFYVDQISDLTGIDWPSTPSGHDCLSFYGSSLDPGKEGRWLSGYADPSYFEVTSGMAYNLNATGYCSGGSCGCGSTGNLLSASPVVSDTYQTKELACDQWQWYNGWEMRVDKRAFAPLGFGIVLLSSLMKMPHTPLIGVPGIYILRPVPTTAFTFGAAQLWFDSGNNCLREFILEVEYILQFAVISFCPDVIILDAINQLRSKPNTVVRLSDASFDHIANV